MEIAKWENRSDWAHSSTGDEAPRKAGVYVVYTGKTIYRAGGPDKKGVLYIGKSLVLRNRLYNFWYARHPASVYTGTYPSMTQLILNGIAEARSKSKT